ncbi:MAG: hypothetical protein JSS53_01360 [Proteobacteria bacterium]|nr:hypothetical protein [Pseudomonadota bacterium]
MSKIKSFFKGFGKSIWRSFHEKFLEAVAASVGFALAFYAIFGTIIGLPAFMMLMGSLMSCEFLISIIAGGVLSILFSIPILVGSLIIAGAVVVTIYDGIQGGIKEVKLEQEKEKSESNQLVTTLSSTHEGYQSSDVNSLQKNKGNTASIMQAMGATSGTKLLLSTEVEEQTQSYPSWLFSRMTGFLCSFRSHPEPVVHEHAVNCTA